MGKKWSQKKFNKEKKEKKGMKEMERKFKAFTGGIRGKIEEMKLRGKHNQQDSNENIQLSTFNKTQNEQKDKDGASYNISGGMMRQHSVPIGNTRIGGVNNGSIKIIDTKQMYLRQISSNQAGSLTDSDEPLYDQHNLSTDNNKNTMKE